MSRIFNKSSSSPNIILPAQLKTSPILQKKPLVISKTNSFKSIFAKESPSKQIVKQPVFGGDLQICVESEIAEIDNLQIIPFLVEECILYINREEILKIEGLFRQSGKSTEIQDIRKLYDAKKYVTLHDVPDAHVITGLLKLYLRELPEPIVIFSLYDSFLDYQKNIAPSGDLEPLKKLINSLPFYNKITLKFLCLLLKRASEFESFSKMNSSSLAIVIGPNVMRSKETDIMKAMEESPLINYIMCTMIDNVTTLFSADDLSSYTLEYLTNRRQVKSIIFPSFGELQMRVEERKKTRSFLAAWFLRRPKQEDLVQRKILQETSI